jgi:hypothetical protein
MDHRPRRDKACRRYSCRVCDPCYPRLSHVIAHPVLAPPAHEALFHYDRLVLPLLALALGPILMPGLARLFPRRRDRIGNGDRLDVRREGFERG